MKVNYTNTKLVFAYQVREDLAAALNPNLSDTNNGSSVVRVVVPKKDHGESVMTHHDFDAVSGYQRFAADSVVGVAISRVYRTASNGNTASLGNVDPVKSITRIQTTDCGGQIFDIQLSTQFNDLLSVQNPSQPSLYKVCIEIFFSSGDVEDLILNLKSPAKCKIIVNPEDLGIHGPIPLSYDAEENDETFKATSISKAYRKLSERTSASFGTSQSQNRNLYGVGQNSFYTTFSAPFGFVMDTIPNISPLSPAASPSWLPEGFATSSTSHLTWFTGVSDMTRTYISDNADAAVEGNNIEGNESALLSNGLFLSYFFARDITVKDYTVPNPIEQPIKYLDRAFPETGITAPWGQKFGWFTTLKNGNIVRSNDNSVVVGVDEMNFGVPPIFNSTQFPNSLETNTPEPTNLWGAFTETISTLDQALEFRYNNLFIGPNAEVPNTNVTSAKLVGPLGFNLNDTNASYLLEYNLADTRKYFCFYPFSELQSPTGSFRKGSIYDVTVNAGANFFYMGAAGSYSQQYIPIFKGYTRVLNVLRAGQVNMSGNPSALMSLLIQKIVDDGEESSGYNAIDLHGMSYGSTGTVDANGNYGQNQFNPVDLVMSMLFAGHTYPNGAAEGQLSNKQSVQLPNLSQSPGMMYLYDLGLKALANEAIIQENSGISFEAQDIAFLNSGITPNVYSVKNGPEDAADADNYAVSRNHPIGHPLSEKLTANNGGVISSGEHFTDTSTYFDQNPFSFTSSKFHPDYGESALDTIPSYPYAPTSFVSNADKASYKNYAGPSVGTNSEGYWAVASNGETINQTGGKGIIGVSEVRSNDFDALVKTGTNECLQIIASSVTVGPSTANTLVDGINAAEVSIVYTMDYINTCDGQFETPAGSKITSGTTVAERVTEALNVFPHIEYRPLAMLDVLQSNPFAYTTVVEDDTDVDDISITPINADTYRLTITITSDQSDIIDIDGEATAVPFGDIFSDVPYPGAASTEQFTLPEFSQRYASVEGQLEFARHKSSYITIASSPDWADFTQAAKVIHSTSTDAVQLAFHTPFIGFNDVVNEEDVNTDIFGCTDPTADNYNPAATVDDGSCLDCNDYTNNTDTSIWNLQEDGIQNGTSGMRVGVYDPTGNTPGAYLYGQVGGNNQAAPYWTPQGIYTSPGANYGGAVVATNDYAGSQAVVNLSIKALTVQSGFDNFITYLAQAGENETVWRLKIKPITDTLLSANLNYDTSYSSTDTIPEPLSTATPIYNAVATGGTIFEPTWDNIATLTSNLSGLLAGFPYILELELDTTRFAPTCEYLTDSNNIVLGIMWVGFCSCANTTNDYFSTALSGNVWPWNNQFAFPIIDYATGQCPDTYDVTNAVGDSPYPTSICFQADDALSNCNDYWLYCIANTSQSCESSIDSIDEAVLVGPDYFFDLIEGTITTAIEGVYNASADSFTWNPDITYSVVVTGPDYYFEQTQDQNIAGPSDNVFENQFTGIVNAGEYTVTFTFFSPYDPNFTGDAPCTFTETVTFLPPEEICAEVITGCTDPGADNYDETATVDDGTCDYNDPCVDNLLNPSLVLSVAATPSDSLCEIDTITVNGIDYTSTVIVPLNNGTVTSTVTYTAGTTAVNTFAVLIVPEVTVTNGIDNVVDAINIMFTGNNIPTDAIDGIDNGIGYWSPLFTNLASGGVYTYPLPNLAPGTYYAIVVANPSTTSLTDCGDLAIVQLLEQLTSVNVGLNDPAEDCPEPCIGSDCNDYVLDCTDPEADNYNPAATYDDGSCQYPETFCEQNPNDDLCAGDCTDFGGSPAPRFSSGSLDETICDDVTGSDGECTDPNACNYNPDAPLDVSNNLICDYCSCVDEDDPDCYEDTECDPDSDPDCQGPDGDCPDPSNPDCDPTIYDPCPTGDCGPPLDPCIILGNCPNDEAGGGDDGDTFEDVVVPVEVTCVVDVETADGSELNFSAVQQQAFLCMSQEGQKLLFRMKSAAYYDETDILKLSLIAYLFAGGLNKANLPCLFNCNYESSDKARAYSCSQQWAASGAKFYNSTDSYSRGDIIVYYYLKGKKVTRNYYVATREIQPIDLHPRYFGSGWHRCKDITLRTSDRNNIATGDEEYLQVFWEFMTRFCNECEIGTISEQLEDINNVDPPSLKNYLDPKTTKPNLSGNSGIIGEDGDEIIF